MKTFTSRGLWSRILIVLGSIGMLVGAIDPVEGSAVILPGSLLLALGTFFNQSERHLFAYRAWVFILIAIGVGALWGLSAVGGIGGKSGHSMWWGVLILPYLIGWSMGVWGPGSPRWLLVLGIGVGLWYLAILALVLKHSSERSGAMSALPGIIIAAIGVLTIVGCISRLRRASRHLVLRA
ncbi:MAG TPA: hypothetical protein VN836_00525 [Verrucomicrobiae bacterium]|nr:hypothetical protein [Verrucomicrobiae bacterium]